MEDLDSVDKYYAYLEGLFKDGKWTRLVQTHETMQSQIQPDWLLSPVADRVPDINQLFFTALARAGSEERAVTEAKSFLESALSKSIIDNIASHDGRDLLGGSISLSARSALSQIAYFVSEKSSVTSDRLQYLLVAIYICANNIDAWTSIMTGWQLTESEKTRLVTSFRWNENHHLVRGRVLRWLSLPRGDDFAIAVIPDLEDIQQRLVHAMKLGESERVSAILESIKRNDLALYAAEPAPLVSVALYMQRDSASLFRLTNKLLANSEDTVAGFFAGGLYYLSVGRFDVARKFLSRSAAGSAHGWLAYGLAFSLSDESGHAINAFRSASRLHPKCVLPWLYMGMEYIRTNELKLAQSYLVSALGLCGPENPVNESQYRGIILNEIGLICLRAEQFEISAENMRLCCTSSEASLTIPSSHLAVFFANLGYALIKQRDVDGGAKAFESALRFNRNNGNALAGLAFTHHCRGNLARAIDLYNASLPLISANRKTENLVNNLIQLAVNEFSFSIQQTAAAPLEEDDMIISAF